ncbi:MAG: flagellar basal body-associated protein FliL [Candidatus Omnitrophica bacterium]|nr:flagellar basal body-associated protein FliL [Candidatus Omnitrophota bacterium]
MMRKIKILSLIFVLPVILAATAVFAGSQQDKSRTDNLPALKNAVILIIRHAEKPESGYVLSPQGQERAQAYVKYFQNYTIDSKPLHIDYLFSSADSEKSHRPRLTIEPLSKALGIKIDTRFKNDEFSELAREIQLRPHGKHILICWHHGRIPLLLNALGVDPDRLLPQGKWPADVFCWVIQLRYNENGQLFNSMCINENLMPGDSTKHTLK